MQILRTPLMAVCAILFVAVPVFAETDAALRAAVRDAILTDPRTASMPEAQIESMVDALTVRAEERGVTAEDIAWQPQPVEGAAENACGVTCSLNRALGFDDSAILIPIILGLASMILIVVIGFLLEHHYGVHPVHPRPARGEKGDAPLA